MSTDYFFLFYSKLNRLKKMLHQLTLITLLKRSQMCSSGQVYFSAVILITQNSSSSCRIISGRCISTVSCHLWLLINLVVILSQLNSVLTPIYTSSLDRLCVVFLLSHFAFNTSCEYQIFRARFSHCAA